jgi:N-acetylneuraminic acid mutarotase
LNRKVTIVVTLYAVFLLFSTLQAFFALATSENSWATKEPVPLPSWRIVGVNDKIYAIAGNGDYANVSYSNNAVLEYNPALDMWTAKKQMPIGRGNIATAIYQNRIYVIGGSEGLNQVYDPATDTWEIKTAMPTPRTQLEANVVSGKIYLIGGKTGGQYSTVDLNEVYDPETDSWTIKAPIPHPVVLYASAVVDNKIYIMGGQDEFSSPTKLDLVQIYDPSTDTWSFGAPMNTVVSQAAAGATTGIWAPKRIYVIGGLPDGSVYGTNINQVYNPQNDSWTVGEPMPTARFDLRMTVLNDQLYVMEGFQRFGIGAYCLVNEQYTPIGYGTPTPSPQSPQPQPSEPFPVAWIVASVLSVAIVSVILIIYFRKRSKS